MSDKLYDLAIVGGGIVGVATAFRIQEKHPSQGLTPASARRTDVMEVGVCVGFISVYCVFGAGLVGVLEKIPGAVEKQLRPSAMRHKSPSASEPLEKDILDHLWIEINEL